MASFNKVLLMGNITRDPELRYLPSNQPVVSFGLAVNRRFRDAQGQDREDTTFVDCSAFTKTAELINQYFHKGDPIFVEGRLKLDTWEDKQGGGKRSKLTVVVENLHFLPRRGDGGQGAGGYSQDVEGSAPAPAPARRAPMARPAPGRPQPLAPAQDQPPYDDQQQFKEDDIPF
jgi:single-strand DNA-binding protein